MINTLKAVSSLGVVVSIGWFIKQQDFAAVLCGILSLSTLMLSFLPISSSDNQA